MTEKQKIASILKSHGISNKDCVNALHSWVKAKQKIELEQLEELREKVASVTKNAQKEIPQRRFLDGDMCKTMENVRDAMIEHFDAGFAIATFCEDGETKHCSFQFGNEFAINDLARNASTILFDITDEEAIQAISQDEDLGDEEE